MNRYLPTILFPS